MTAINTAEARKRFILAGNATFTVVSKKTGVRYTYKVRHEEGKPHFVSVLTSPDNYEYMGAIFDSKTFRGKVLSWPSVRAFYWLWGALDSDAMEFHHAGRCGRCGRELTVPESIETGLGPECAKRS